MVVLRVLGCPLACSMRFASISSWAERSSPFSTVIEGKKTYCRSVLPFGKRKDGGNNLFEWVEMIVQDEAYRFLSLKWREKKMIADKKAGTGMGEEVLKRLNMDRKIAAGMRSPKVRVNLSHSRKKVRHPIMPCMKVYQPLFYKAIERDPKISVSHISLYMALFCKWNERSGRNPIELVK
jgi:hypothetical protein